MSTIPSHTKGALDRYVEHGLQPGGFLCAVLSNQFMEAFARADEENREAMFDIACYVYNEIPGNCHGSPEIVAEWVRKRTAKRFAREDQEDEARVSGEIP